MTDVADNPAERLESLLVSYCLVGKRMPAQSNWSAWAYVFGADDSPIRTDSADFLARLSSTVALPGKVRSAVDALVADEDRRTYLLRHLEKIEAGLAFATHEGHAVQAVWEHFARGGDVDHSAALYALQGCAQELRLKATNSGLREAEAQELTKLINEMLEAVIDSSLEESDKLFLREHLNAMLVAVQEVRIRGRRGVEEATDAAAGAIVRRKGLLARLVDAQFLDSVRTFFQRTDTVLAIADQAVQLEQGVSRMLESGFGQ